MNSMNSCHTVLGSNTTSMNVGNVDETRVLFEKIKLFPEPIGGSVRVRPAVSGFQHQLLRYRPPSLGEL